MGAFSTAGMADETAASLQNALNAALENPDLLSDTLLQIRCALGH